MKWTAEAENAIKKVPFFVRKKVRGRVEKEALAEGKSKVTLVEVNATRQRFLSNMETEIKGYQLDTCFGQGGCPNIANDSKRLFKRIEKLLKKEDLLGFLKKTVDGDLKFHHEFRVSIADCPNACSQPQIKDIGIIGASLPEVTTDECSMCGACVDLCKDHAISLDNDSQSPVIDSSKCLVCGMCARECPTGTIKEKKQGYRIMLGGKLGRHPRLAEELPEIFNEDQVIEIVQKCIDYYKANSTNGKRFADIYPGPEFLNL